MIKLIMSFVIVGCSTLIGIEMARGYVLRTKELRELQSALARLEAEILHYLTRLPEALKLTGESVGGEVGNIFISVSEKLVENSNLTISQVWRKTIDEFENRLYLHKEDLEILQRLGDNLGSGNKEGQKKYINITLMQLNEQEQKAQEQRSKYEKMYRSLGVLCGLAIAIILF